VRDSNLDIQIPWIEQVPRDWKTVKLARVTRINTGDMDTIDSTDDGVYPFYVRSPIVRRAGRFTFNTDAVLMSGDGAGAGRIFHRVSGKFACHQRVYCIEFLEQVTKDFGFYYLSIFFPMQVDAGSAKSTVDSIRKPMLNGMPIVFPPVTEQRRITSYIDRKTAEIDGLIEKLRREVELLEQYRRELIARTVTRGLDPDAPMRDSGIEWIGAIPAAWSLQSLKTMLRRTNIKNKPERRVLSVERVKGVVDRETEGSPDNHNRLPEDLSGYLAVNSGQFVMNKMKAWRGSYGVSTLDGIVSPAYYVFDLEFVEPKFFNWAIRSAAYVPFFGRDSYGIRTDQWDFKVSALRSIPFFSPSRKEQKAIVSYLERETSVIDSTVTGIYQQIELLEQYRKQVINDAVTGKIRVGKVA
jgi:restriction modification system DNA specificity domain protein